MFNERVATELTKLGHHSTGKYISVCAALWELFDTREEISTDKIDDYIQVGLPSYILTTIPYQQFNALNSRLLLVIPTLLNMTDKIKMDTIAKLTIMLL